MQTSCKWFAYKKTFGIIKKYYDYYHFSYIYDITTTTTAAAATTTTTSTSTITTTTITTTSTTTATTTTTSSNTRSINSTRGFRVSAFRAESARHARLRFARVPRVLFCAGSALGCLPFA